MKKIVGIMAAAAIATSVFAADVSAATKLKGTVLSYDNAETFSLFSEVNDSHDYANPNMTFSVSDDKAGATIKLTTDGDNEAVKQTTQTIWFKPIDALKITVGNFDVALNKEQIDWTESVTGLGGNGFLFSINAEGFGLDFGLSQADNAFWLSKAKAADDPTISSFFVKAGYSADFGNIGAFAEFNRAKSGRRTWAFHDSFFAEDVTIEGTKKVVYVKDDGTVGVKDEATSETKRVPCFKLKDGAIGDILFGASYRNNFNGIDVFANFNGYMADKFEWLRPEVYVSGSADALGYSLFVAPLVIVDSDVKDALEAADEKAFQCEVVAKVTYALDGCTPYVYFKDADLVAKDFAATIKAGATGNVGAMGWNAWLQIDTGKGDKADKVDISVPFELTMSF
jgi:hypothetical protein